MRKGISITVSAADRRRLEAVVADRNSPQKHVWRARIILLSDAGLGTMAIMRRTGKSKSCVWRWQERFMEEGVAGLLRDKTRP
jgi:transposase